MRQRSVAFALGRKLRCCFCFSCFVHEVRGGFNRCRYVRKYKQHIIFILRKNNPYISGRGDVYEGGAQLGHRHRILLSLLSVDGLRLPSGCLPPSQDKTSYIPGTLYHQWYREVTLIEMHAAASAAAAAKGSVRFVIVHPYDGKILRSAGAGAALLFASSSILVWWLCCCVCSFRETAYAPRRSSHCTTADYSSSTDS